MAVITFGNRLDPLATPLHRMIEKYLSNRQRDSWAVFFVALRLWCEGITAHPESVASTRLPGIPHHWNSVMSRYILKCCTGRGRADGFSRYSQPKRASFDTKWFKMIQSRFYKKDPTTTGLLQRLLPKVMSRFKRFKLYRVWRVHTQAMWSQPEIAHSFSIAVAAYNIQEPKSQKSKISNHSVHSDTFRYIHILQGSLCKMKSITAKLMLRFGERQERSRKQQRAYHVFPDNRKQRNIT